jgi:hypothetical protein
MSTTYTRDCAQPANIAHFYRWLKVQPTNNKWVEKIAVELLERLDDFKSIACKERGEGYKTPGHNGVRKYKDGNGGNREKQVANDLFLMSANNETIFSTLGKFIDYETPLGTSGENTIGDIDLLAYNDDTQEYTAVELKNKNNGESLLRGVVEIYTYSKRVCFDRLKKDFCRPSTKPLRKALLVFKDKKQHRNYLDQPKVRELMQKLGVELFVMSGDNAEHYVIEPVRI